MNNINKSVSSHSVQQSSCILNVQKTWESEPNRLEFHYRGYPCIILRLAFDDSEPNAGHLCGYVGLPKSHAFFGKHYDSIPLDVHGGITYASAAIPHCDADGQYWWVGFDCAHIGDLIPRPKRVIDALNVHIKNVDILEMFNEILNGSPHYPKTYKTVGFVKNEIRNLVKQLNCLQWVLRRL